MMMLLTNNLKSSHAVAFFCTYIFCSFISASFPLSECYFWQIVFSSMLGMVYLCSWLEPVANIEISKLFCADITLIICVIRWIFMSIKDVFPENKSCFLSDILLNLMIFQDMLETSLGFCYNISWYKNIYLLICYYLSLENFW